jgi:hypothetical protein
MTRSCCASPQPEFTIRNEDHQPLASGTKALVTLPGIIPAEGLDDIGAYLRSLGYSDLSYDLGPVGSEWQTRKGNFTKRLSGHAYKAHAVKLPQYVLSGVGSIARDHSQEASFMIEVTRRLNMSSASFGNPGSCWWDSYRRSRCALKTNGGFGLRAFGQKRTIRERIRGTRHVTGRAWVLPLRLTNWGGLTPTFDTMTPSAFAVFNGYGELSGYAAPRVLAHMAGWTYRKVTFSCDPMYVNSGIGYLIGPGELTERYRDRSLSLDVERHSTRFEDEQRELARQAEEAAHAKREKRCAAARKAAATRKANAEAARQAEMRAS